MLVARKIAREAYHATRNFPDRMLHQRRNAAVRKRLATLQRPSTILVVCHGNICRSPYLQAVLQRDLPDIVVRSAGFFGSDRPVPSTSIEISAKRGIDLSNYRSRPLTQSIVVSADLVIVMDPNQARQITRLFPFRRARIVVAADLDPKFDESRTITDPWNGTEEVFAAAFDRLDRCAASLGSVMRSR